MGKEKVVIEGKIYTTFSDGDTLLITKEKIDDLIFAMQFKSGEMRKLFDKLLADIDCNTYNLNWVKITFENALTRKQQAELKKSQVWLKPKKNKKHQIEWRKASILREKDLLKKQEWWVNHHKKSIKEYETEIKRLKQK